MFGSFIEVSQELIAPLEETGVADRREERTARAAGTGAARS